MAMDDVQSWWEVPCIAHFCSLFRTSFDLLDFNIEELEEALLTDSAEEVGSSLIQDLIVRLLKGCFNTQKDDITSCNYQMFLRRLFRIKCEEDSTRNNPFNDDVAFQSLSLRIKVEILHNLCDFRLDTDDVQDLLKSIESDSLRVDPLGQDSGGSTYWYFYGTRLYREDYNTTPKNSPVKKRGKGVKAEGSLPKDRKYHNPNSKWQVVCFTEEDWQLLTSKFKNCKSKHEKSLHRTLREDFLPELPRLFAEKEKLMRNRMLDKQLRRSNRAPPPSSPSDQKHDGDLPEDESKRKRLEQEKADRVLAEEIQREERKAQLFLRDRRGSGRSGGTLSLTTSGPSNSGALSSSSSPRTESKNSKSQSKRPGSSESKGRMTNNSLSASLLPGAEEQVGLQIPDEEEDNDQDDDDRSSVSSTTSPQVSPVSTPKKKGKKFDSSWEWKSGSGSEVHGKRKHPNDEDGNKKPKKPKLTQSSRDSEVMSGGGSNKTKFKSSVIFSQNEEDINIGMHKVIEAMKIHRDAWPFANPVDELYAPGYLRVISSPMDLQTMEDKLDNHEYITLEDLRNDFQKIIANCHKYNGLSSEYTKMVDNLQIAFEKAIQRYIIPDESDEEISIEYNPGHLRKIQKSSVSRVKSDHKKAERSAHSGDKSREHKVSAKDTKKAHDQKHERSKEKIESKSDRKHSNTEKKKKSLKGKTEKIPDSEKAKKKLFKEKLMRHHPKNSDTNSATVKTLKDLGQFFAERRNSREQPKGHSSRDSSPDGIKEPSLKQVSKDVKVSGPISSSDSTLVPPKKRAEKHREAEKGPRKSKEFSKRKLKDGREKKKHKSSHHTHSQKRASSKSPSRSTKEVSKSTKSEKPSSSRKKKNDKHPLHSEDGLIPLGSNAIVFGRNVPPPPPTKPKRSDAGSTKSQTKRILQAFRNVGSVKRLQVGKATKFNIGARSGLPSGHQDPIDPMLGTQGKYSSRVVDQPSEPNNEKTGRPTGPKLSLGTVLPRDVIKFPGQTAGASDDEEEPDVDSQTAFEDDIFRRVEKTFGPEAVIKTKAVLNQVIKGEGASKEEEEVRADRKLEPNQGFNRDKTLPNLSAWIKTFGGPGSKSGSGLTTPKKENKFMVMGRGVGDIPPWRTGFGVPFGSPVGGLTPRHKVSYDTGPRHGTGIGSNNSPQKRSHQPEGSGSPATPAPLQSPGVISTPEGECEKEEVCRRSRGRKMSTSSMSSQSEAGSPACFQPGATDEIQTRGGIVINPPRWVESETWGSQSQSPSASSQVSSQSPQAGPNSPFSPQVLSPPETSPRAPVRVGFYQDMSASAISSPEKGNECKSPSQPSPQPSRTTGGGGTQVRSRDPSDERGNVAPPSPYHHPSPGYVPRYGGTGSSTPSPSSKMGPGPGSDYPSYTGTSPPGGPPSSSGSVDSPQAVNVGSPHSPSVGSHPPTPGGGLNLSDYNGRGGGGGKESPGPAHTTYQTSGGGTTGGQGFRGPPLNAHSSHPPVNIQGRASAMNLNSGISGSYSAPGPSPYPGALNGSSYGSLVDPHGYRNHTPEVAHNHTHAHNVYAHSHSSTGRFTPAAAHILPHPQVAHQAHLSTPASATSPSTLAHAHRGSLAFPVPSSSASQPQGSPYPSNPYTSNPRSINLAPSVYSNNERFYKGEPLGLGMIPGSTSSLTITTTSNPTPTSRGRKAQAQAQAYAAAETNSNNHSSGGRGNYEGSGKGQGQSNSGTHGPPEMSVNGFQWTHNLASLSQFVSAIPNSMSYMNRASPHLHPAHYNESTRSESPRGVGTMSGGRSSNLSGHHPTPAHGNENHDDGRSSGTNPTGHVESNSFSNAVTTPNPPSGSGRRAKGEKGSKSSKGSNSSSSSSNAAANQGVPGSAFNFSTMAPDLSMYSKDIAEHGGMVASLTHPHHRPDLYPTSTANFHPSFGGSGGTRSTSASGVPGTSIAPYQIPPYLGSHPSPYQPQPVSSQPYHSQSPRGIVDTYQQFFQGSPHVMGLLPPAGYGAPYPHPHSLGFNRPGWI